MDVEVDRSFPDLFVHLIFRSLYIRPVIDILFSSKMFDPTNHAIDDEKILAL
jgi:hypothetical protein